MIYLDLPRQPCVKHCKRFHMRPLLVSEPELASDFRMWHVCPGSYIFAPAMGMQVDLQASEQVGECPPSSTLGPCLAPLSSSLCLSATSFGPDSNGDCRCNNGLTCYESDWYGCTYAHAATYVYYSSQRFLPSCSNCLCLTGFLCEGIVEM